MVEHRGRPLRPIREVDRRPGWYGCEDLVAWLLRVNRINSSREPLSNMRRFAAAFRGGTWPSRASVSQISRWETGEIRASFNVIRRYEELLGFSRGQLVAVADWAYRKASSQVGPPVLGRGLDPEDPRVRNRTEQLLEQALSARAIMTGADWDELTSHLVVFPGAFLYPSSAWTDLAERLLAELLIASGPAWLTRIEALTRLMGHPRALPPIVAACGALAADPANQVVVEPLAILSMTAHADANRNVLTQLSHPASDRALRGALLSSIEKVPRRHFRTAQLTGLAASAAELLNVADLATESRQLAAEVLRQMPSGQLNGGYRDQLLHAADPIARSIFAAGQTAMPNVTGHVIARIITTATRYLPGSTGDDTDPILSRLANQLLFSPNPNQRILAGLLISATPYRDAIGAALAAELTGDLGGNVVPWTTTVLASLPFLGRPADRRMVERLILAPGLPAPVTDRAAWTIGHIPGESDHRFWLTAIQIHRRAWQRTHSVSSLSVLRGLIYALGIGDQRPLLAAVAADTSIASPARTAATWWLNIPSRISASAAH